MAANTQQSGSGIKHRWFQIGRKDFQDAGDAVFREFLKEGPPPAESWGKRQFTKHPKTGAWYEQFESIDGVITDIKWEQRTIKEQPSTMMNVVVEDSGERFIIELGDWDGRFAKNFMQRICHPSFDARVVSILKPYAMKPTSGEHAGKLFMGVTIYNGETLEGKPRKIETRYADDKFPLPQPEEIETEVITGPGQTEIKKSLDYRKQANFLVLWLRQNVIPYLPKDVYVATSIVEEGAEFVDDEKGAATFPDDPSFPTDPPPYINTKITARHEPPEDLPF